MPEPRRGRSLRGTLALWMLPALLVMFAVSIWLMRSNMVALADSAYDRSLAGAVRAIELNISTDSGGLGLELPYPLFTSLQATASGTVYFRVSTDDGMVQIGDAGLPPPPALADGQTRFYDGTYLDEPIRIGAYRKRLPVPLYGAATPQAVTIEVAETLGSRTAFQAELNWVAFRRDMAVTLAAGLLLTLALGAALRPLGALRARFDRRRPDDLSPLDPSALPSEIRPLVDSFNALLRRHADQAEIQRRFLDDASHQLRTPIAVLRTQLDYALTREDPAEQRAVIEAMRPVIDRSARTTGQMLALARAGAMPDLGPVDLGQILSEAARLHLPAARRRRIALELDLPEVPVLLNGAETLLYEAVSNLLDNAIRLSPTGGTVTATLVPAAPAGADLTITDEGPGMSAEALARVGERFLAERDPARRSAGGSGLGLAVVAAIARAHGGTFRVANRVHEDGQRRSGLAAHLGFRGGAPG